VIMKEKLQIVLKLFVCDGGYEIIISLKVLFYLILESNSSTDFKFSNAAVFPPPPCNTSCS
jgi:hypothetical protein